MMPETGLQSLFLKTGENATFTNGTVRCVPAFDLYSIDAGVEGFGGIVSIEARHTMLVMTEQWNTLSPEPNASFTLTDGTYLYHMTALEERPDMTGISEITVAFREKTHV